MRVGLWPVVLSLAIGGCGGRIVPPSAGPAVAPRGAPARVLPRSGATSPLRIVPATPIAPMPAAVVPGAATALAAGVLPGPPIETLPIGDAQADAALRAFVATCPALLRRADTSGLTRSTDWATACAAARDSAPATARSILAAQFEAAQIGDGRAFATGYYEPEIAGSRERRPGYDVPVYARPNDLIEVDLGAFSTDLKGKRIRGRVDGTSFVPYYDRAAIEDGAIAGRARVLAWAADPVDMFFLQIQGSGRLRLLDGAVLRIGYDSQNGREYTGIGSVMRQRGLLAPGQASMQGIVAWLRAHPDEGRALMRENKSFVFFRELSGAPIGALGAAVMGKVSAAADAKFVPLGAPVFLSLDRADATGLWIAQDTGGAIKGTNRFDTFWGAGEGAAATAGGMSAHGSAFLLLPRGTLARLQASAVNAGGADGGAAASPR